MTPGPPDDAAARIARHSATPFVNQFGRFELQAFEFADGAEHAVLIHGTPRKVRRPLVRVQSSCLTGTAMGALLCDCRQQVELSLQYVVDAGAGIVLYLDQEGRGHGLVEKVSQLRAISQGSDTVDAAVARGFAPDVRTYHQAAVILAALLGEGMPLALLTNNPVKLVSLQHAGVEVAERVAIEATPTDQNLEYLRVKKRRMGHLLTRV